MIIPASGTAGVSHNTGDVIARPRRHRRSRAQATVELAIVLPLLVVLWSLGTDGARAYTISLAVRGAARAGALTAIISSNSSVGSSVRAASSDYPDGVWGADDTPGGPDAQCPGAGDLSPRTPCGDPQGCVPTSGFWKVGSPQACFSLGWCWVSAGACNVPTGCTPNRFQPCWSSRPPTGWSANPGPGGGVAALDMRVCVQERPLVLSAGGLGSLFNVCADAVMEPGYP